MKGLLALLMIGSIAAAQVPEIPQSKGYTFAEVTQAFGTCRQYIETAKENHRRFPMPQLEELDPTQSGAAWLEACVLSELQGNPVEIQPLS